MRLHLNCVDGFDVLLLNVKRKVKPYFAFVEH